ncbi:MAG: coenzyme F420-0:L-glutamate ligase [Holosporales bacterium]|jgi:putative folate metabolism gamma-glutamate ligase|nr:coenzyme F420-0:L-glutamate ligase [Holosporales bacterium]
MRVLAYKTHKVEPNEDLLALVDRYVPPLEEGDVVALTSKVVALCQGRVLPEGSAPDKAALVREESEWFLEEDLSLPESIAITIKEGILIASAGIDTSNGHGNYILWPKNPHQAAAAVWEHLRARDGLERLGVLLTDSQTRPLRWGVVGVGIAWCGFSPLWDCRGAQDIWGRPLQFTKINVLDGLAASAVLSMGESAEQTPIAVLREAPYVRFSDTPPTDAEMRSLRISLQEDLYTRILQAVPWKKGAASS